MAPEWFDLSTFHLSNGSPAEDSDVYSFAMTAYEARLFRTVHCRQSSLTLLH